MSEIVFRKLGKADLSRFIDMRQECLVGEGNAVYCENPVDLTADLRKYYGRHMAEAHLWVGWRFWAARLLRRWGVSFIERVPTFGAPNGKVG
jgi:hypothetical protein